MGATGQAKPQSTITRARKRALGRLRRLRYRLTTSTAERRADSIGKPERWEFQQRFQFEFLKDHGLRPEHRVLDIGCGPLRVGIPLIEYLQPGNYTGIEARPEVAREARKAVAEAGLEDKRPTVINEADPGDVRLETQIDFAWAFMVLIHLSDEILDGYLKLIAGALGENGVFYGNVRLGEFPEGNWKGFPFISHPREFYERAAATHGLRIEDVGTLESLGHKVGSVGDEMMMLRFLRAG